MKKPIRVLTVLFAAILLFSISVAAANNVSEIGIDITLRPDGSAYIVQNWQGTFTEGTENYIPIYTDGIAISDFRVSDINGAYELLPDWDIHASFAEKAGKCGIVTTKDGVELCFGITNYGQNRYAIEYVVEDFIKSYQDYDGTNFMLVNPGMNTFPTDCRVSIVLQDGTALSANNAGIWAFGFEGQIEFLDGKVNAYTTKALRGDNRVIVMLQLNKDILSPRTQVSKSFETVKKQAFAGSDYQDDSTSLAEKIFVFVIVGLILAALIAVLASVIARKREIARFYKSADYFREIPNGGDISVSYFLARRFDVISEKGPIIGALLLDMINHGQLQPLTEENVGMFGKVKQSVSLKLCQPPEGDLQKKLYTILECAAGADGVLQEKELEKYTYRHYERLDDFMKSAERQGDDTFSRGKGFLSSGGNRISKLSDSGKRSLAEVMGFKKYLEEFSLISERELRDVGVWKEFMVYAMLFDIADRVKEQLKKLYPRQAVELDDLDRNVIICHTYHQCMYHSYQRAMSARSSGAGGASSIGGGGGFSGGGFGGGSR